MPPPAPAGQLVLGRDYVLDAASRRASDNGVVLFSSLPSLSKLKKDPKERTTVLRFKLLQCSYIFQFVKKESHHHHHNSHNATSPKVHKEKVKEEDPDAPAKKAKLKAFDEILHLVNQKSFQAFEAPTVTQIVDTLASNLFITFPPIIEPPFYLVKSKPLWKERPPEVLHDALPGWIHREKAYTLFLRLLQRCVETVQHGPMKRILSESINDRFIRRLLDLFMSPDNRERDMLTNILIHLYVHFTGLRVLLQNAIKDVLCRFVSERLWTEHRAATEIAGILNLSAEIVNMQGFGFGYHQKSARTELFLLKIVLPLYQADAECVSRYNQSLFTLVNRCVYKQPALCQLTVTSLLRAWPRQCTFKQGIFLNQLTGLFLCLESAHKEILEERKQQALHQKKDSLSNVKTRSSGVKSLDLGREGLDSPGPKRPNKSIDLSSSSPRADRSGSAGRMERQASREKSTPTNRDGARTAEDEDSRRRSGSPRDTEGARGSYKNLPGIFMHVEEIVNPFDYMTPVSEQLFKKILECISHSQACVSQAAIQMLSLPAVTTFCLRDEVLRTTMIPKLYHALSQVSSHPFQSLRQTIVHLMLLLERAGGGALVVQPPPDDGINKSEMVRKRNERWDSVEKLSQLQSLKKPEEGKKIPSWNLIEMGDIDGLDALLKKYIAETEDETQVVDSESSSSSEDDDEDRDKETLKPDLNSLKIVPPRSRAVVMVRNGSKQANTVSDLMAATPTRRATAGFASPARLSQGFWRNSASKSGVSPGVGPDDSGILELDAVPMTRTESEEKYGPSSPSTPFNLLPPPSVSIASMEIMSSDELPVLSDSSLNLSDCSKKSDENSSHSAPPPPPARPSRSDKQLSPSNVKKLSENSELDPCTPPNAPRNSSSRGSNSFESSAKTSDENLGGLRADILSTLRQP